MIVDSIYFVHENYFMFLSNTGGISRWSSGVQDLVEFIKPYLTNKTHVIVKGYLWEYHQLDFLLEEFGVDPIIIPLKKTSLTDLYSTTSLDYNSSIIFISEFQPFNGNVSPIKVIKYPHSIPLWYVYNVQELRT